MRSDLLVGCLLPLAACGSLVDGTWPGEPLLVFAGTVFLDDDGFAQTVDLDRLETTVSFIDPFGEPTGAAVLGAEDLSATTTFPAQYTMEVFQPPPEQARFITPWDPEGPVIAVALPLLYLDDDGDGLWDAGTEELVGGTVDVVGVWSASAVSTEGWDTALWLDSDWDSADTGLVYPGPTGELPLRAGYQRMNADIRWCGGRTDAPTSRFDLFPAEALPTDMFVGRWFRDLTQWGCWQEP